MIFTILFLRYDKKGIVKMTSNEKCNALCIIKIFYFCFLLYFQQYLARISHNVLGIRRFASPNKGLRSKTMAGKMWLE